MSTPAIELGKPQCILRLPKAAMRNAHAWTQMDSDILAHLIQVQSQIQQSRWNKSDVRFSLHGARLKDCSFPDFEDFVFAAVYFRQLIAKKDKLLQDAVTRYCQFVDCSIRPSWVGHELDSFNRHLASDAFMMPGHSVRELFEAFMYGAGLVHKIPKLGDKNRKRFLEVYDKEPRHKVLFALNSGLRTLKNYAGNVALVIHRDYVNWLRDYSLPLPDTRWHESLFEIAGHGDHGPPTGA